MPSKNPVVLSVAAAIILASAGAIALLRSTPQPPTSGAQNQKDAVPGAALEAVGGTETIAGTALERIDVDKYTYLRLDRGDSAPVWAAIATAPVKVGDRVALRNTQLMTNFTSPTLKRKFDAIYFGVLDEPSGSAGHGHEASGHPQAAVGNPHDDQGALQADSPEVQAAHATPFRSGDAVQVGKLKRAEGPRGRSVADIHAQRQSLNGKPVRVRGVVVKSVPGVLGKTFVHVRDGTGNSDATRDLTVTTEAVPALGAQVLFEGTVNVDKDFGSGYRYSVLIENAKTLED
ncbi:MAG TPA: hypothetical protein VI072_15635 [Polyangiaceae bacterium]